MSEFFRRLFFRHPGGGSGRDRVLISAQELRESGRRPAVLDVRWRLDQPDGRDAYRGGHIPGAVYVSLEDDLSDHRVSARGRHPLPSGPAVQAAARRWGIRNGQPVVVYDDWNRAGSSRAWWVLRAAGVHDVRILDGGLGAWIAAGGELETGEAAPAAGDIEVSYPDLYAGALPTLTDTQVAGVRTLLDARAPERFRGEVEPVDPVAGHIPGAANLPSTALLAADGRFRPGREIAAMLAARGGAEPVGVYCGSGVTASVVVAALRIAGVDAALFPGSWSEWSSMPDRPVERGDSPAAG